MADLRDTTADSLQVRNAPQSPTDVVRLQELNAALATHPTSQQVGDAIAAIAHAPVTAGTSKSTVVGLNGQILTVEVNPKAQSVIQAAATGQTVSADTIDPTSELDLLKVSVRNVVVTKNLVSNNNVVTTGVEGIDYFLDALNGIITFCSGSNVVNTGDATTKIVATFDCDQVSDGAGLVAGNDGAAVDFGDAHDKVPRADRVVALEALMHQPVTPDPSAQTTVATIDAHQRLKIEVRLGAGLKVDNTGKVAVDFSQVATAGHSHSVVSNSAAGFMSPTMLGALNALAATGTMSFTNTGSITLTLSSGALSADLRVGTGLMIGKIDIAGNNIAGLFGDENIFFGLTLTPDTWPDGWPNTVYWGISVSGSNITLNISSDAAGTTVLASATWTTTQVAATPYVASIHLASDNSIIGTVTANTATAYAVNSGQAIILTPNGVYVDQTVVAMKSTTDNHETRIATLESTTASQGAAITTLNAQVANLAANVLTSAQAADFSCLQVLLDKWEFAHKLMSTLRLEAPNVGTVSGGSYAGLSALTPRSILISGDPTQTFTVDLQVIGITKLKTVWAGTTVANTGSRANKGGKGFVTDGTPIDSLEQAEDSDDEKAIEGFIDAEAEIDDTGAWLLTVQDNGSGVTDKYYLNTAILTQGTSVSDADGGPVVLNYLLKGVTIKGGSRITLQYLSTGSQTAHSLVAPGVPPNPASFGGYFLQVDAYSVAACSLLDERGEGATFGIAIPGAPVKRDAAEVSGSTGANGVPGFNGGTIGVTPQTDGTEQPSGAGDSSRSNQPRITPTRDLQRLAMMEDGGADDIIWDILINGGDVWVAGAFTRYDNHASPGLAKLDNIGRYAVNFTGFAAGFSEIIRSLGLTPDGKVLASSLNRGTFQNQNSHQVHRLNPDGSADTTFNPSPDVAANDGSPNLVLGLAGLADGKVAVLTPRSLTVYNSDGTLFSRNNTTTDMFLAVLGVSGNRLLLSSHAWTSANHPQLYGNVYKPRGLKLLDEGSGTFSLDSLWAQSSTAGTGAMSSCGRAIAGPLEAYFVAGNALTRYNSIDTSWNCEILGNLLLQSENLGNDPWEHVGTLDMDNDDAPNGVGGCATSMNLNNSGGPGSQAYIRQTVTVEPNVNGVFQFYVRKQAHTTFPVIELSYGSADAVDAYFWLDTQLGTYQIQNVTGAGNPTVSIIEAPTDSNFWFVTFTLTNASNSNNELTVTIFPAYSSAMGGSSESVIGSMQIAAPEVRYDFWSSTYVPTTTAASPPSVQASNAARFQGLYKILANGAADPTFDCVLTYATGQEGMAIPFAIDGRERIYFGGPVTSIHGTTVKPWRLYRITKDGAFDAVFDDFNDDVLVARLMPNGDIIAGGKFTAYGTMAAGRLIRLDYDGNPRRDWGDSESPVIVSATAPDVLLNPGAKEKLWYDTSSDPKSLKSWSDAFNAWVDVSVGGLPQLPAVSISESPTFTDPSTYNGTDTVAITLTEAISGSTIWYTTDGTDPRLSAGSRTHYTVPFNISAPTIVKAYATKSGFADTVVTTRTYGAKLAMPVVNPPSENLAFPVTVTITPPVGATQVKYTTDGSDPLTSGTAQVYSAPFQVGTGSDTSATVIVVATGTGYFSSDEVRVDYGDNIMPELTVNPAAGTDIPVAITFALPTTFPATYQVVYTATTDGSDPADPTTSLQAVTAPGPLTIQVNVATRFRAYAKASGWTPTPVIFTSYGVKLASPTFSAGTDTTSLLAKSTATVIITGPVGSTIKYQLNGGAILTAASPAVVDLTERIATTITAWATQTGWGDSDKVTSATYPSTYFGGLTDVNYSPNQVKVGRGVLWSDAFLDKWNFILGDLLPPGSLQKNFYADGIGPGLGSLSLFRPGATHFSSTAFDTVPTLGDESYRTALRLTSVRTSTNYFTGIAAGIGLDSLGYNTFVGYVAITSHGQIWFSADGTTWTMVKDKLPRLRRVFYCTTAYSSIAGNRWFVGGENGTVLTSADGVNWTAITGLPTTAEVFDVTVVTNLGGDSSPRVLVAADNSLYRSNISSGPGFGAFTKVYTSTIGNIRSIQWDKFGSVATTNVVIVGDGGQLLYATQSSVTTAAPVVMTTIGLLTNSNFQRVTFSPGSIGYGVIASQPTPVFYLGIVSTGLQNVSGPYAFPVSPGPLRDICQYSQVVNSAATNGLIVASQNHLFFVNGSGGMVEITPGVGGNTGPAAFDYRGVTANGNTVYAVGDGGIIVGTQDPITGLWAWVSVNSAAPAVPEMFRGSFTGITLGFYDLLLFGHGPAEAQNSEFGAYLDGVSLGATKKTSAKPDYANASWQENRQYVRWPNLETVLGSIDFTLIKNAAVPIYVLRTVQETEFLKGVATFTPDNAADGDSSKPLLVSYKTTLVNPSIALGAEITGALQKTNWANPVASSNQLNSIFSTSAGTTPLGVTPVAGHSYTVSFVSSSGGVAVALVIGGSVSYAGTYAISSNGASYSFVAEAGGTYNITATGSGSISYQLNVFELFNTYSRTALRTYYADVLEQQTGWINAIQLNRQQKNTRLGLPVILPESPGNLPLVFDTNGEGGVGISAASTDISLGVSGGIKFYYTVTSGDHRADTTNDPTGPDGGNPGALYTGPLSLIDDLQGKTVKAIAILNGRTISNVAKAYYAPKFNLLTIANDGGSGFVIGVETPRAGATFRVESTDDGGGSWGLETTFSDDGVHTSQSFAWALGSGTGYRVRQQLGSYNSDWSDILFIP